MLNHSLARPYAKALFAWATAHDAVADCAGHLVRLSAIVNDADMQRFLKDPRHPQAQKIAPIAAIAKLASPHVMHRFLHILAHYDRILLMPTIHALYQDDLHQQTGIQAITIITARPCDDSDQTAFKERLQQMYPHKQCKLRFLAKPSLIGGFRIKINDDTIDCSIQGQQHRLRQKLASFSMNSKGL